MSYSASSVPRTKANQEDFHSVSTDLGLIPPTLRFHLRFHGPLTDQCSVEFDVSTPIGSVYRETSCRSPMFSSHARIFRQPAARKPLDPQELEVFTLSDSCPARDSHLYREPQENRPGCRSLPRTCLYYSCNSPAMEVTNSPPTIISCLSLLFH